MRRRGPARGLTSAGHVLKTLDIVSKHPEGVPAKQVARRLGINLSSAYHAIHSLEEQGLVEPSPVVPGLYTLGPQVVRLYSGYVAATVRPERLQPAAQHLRDIAGARSYVGVWNHEDLEVAYAKGRRGSHELQNVAGGFRGAAHALSLGKIYLASLPESEWPAYLRRDEFTAYTDSTVVTGSELRAELADVRDNGFAVDEHEFKPGACCVAAPVYDASKQLIAAIGISVSARRYLRDRDALIEAVQLVARDASSTLPAPLAQEGA